MIHSDKIILLLSSFSQLGSELRMGGSSCHSRGVGDSLGGGELGGAFGVAAFGHVFRMPGNRIVRLPLELLYREKGHTEEAR